MDILTLNEAEYPLFKKSKSPYFDTKHYTFNATNIIRWAEANDRLIEVPIDQILDTFNGYISVHASNAHFIELEKKLGRYIGKGVEAIVFKNKEEGKVYKVMCDDSLEEDSWTIAKRKMVQHNRVFPETSYKIAYVIYCSDRMDTPDNYLLVLCQDNLNTRDIWKKLCSDSKTKIADDGREYKETPIDRFLAEKGFNSSDHFDPIGLRTYKKGRTYVDDIHSGNMGIDKEGNFKVFDALINVENKRRTL